MKFRILALATLAGFTSAAPDQATIISGSATVEQSGSGTTITQQTQQAWIDWQEFSIAEDEWVHFQQLLDNGLTVNRVTGNNISGIFGSLTSNGTVYLVNPNGILFGENSQLDVGSLFATDHWLETDGSLTSSSQPSAGIQVLGTLASREDLTLLAESIQNSGSMSAENLSLITSKGALLHLDEQGQVSVLVPADAGESSWVENTGALFANQQLYLGSPHKNDWLNELAAEANVSVSGELSAQAIDIQGTNIDVMNADMNAQLINIESQNRTYIGASNLSALDDKIRIRGKEIQLHSGTRIDVGSGQLTIGGNFQGAGQDNNADFVHVSSTVHLYGNGGVNGHGGEIILWSDGTTSFHGKIEAKGGTESGDGGFVEVSGKESLVFRGDVDTYAVNGDRGTLLLDPTTITIADGSGTDVGNGGATAEIVSDADGDSVGLATIYEANLEAIAAGTDIQLIATERIEIADLTDNELTLDQGLTLTVNSASGGSIQMLGADDTIRFTEEDTLQVIVNGNGNGVTSYVDINDVVFDAGGDFLINVQHSGDATSNAYISIGNVTNNTSGTENTLNFLVNNSSAPTTMNINGDITWNGNEALNHYLYLTTQTGGATAGLINNYGDLDSSGGDIRIQSGAMNLLDPDGRNTVSALNFLSAGGEVDLTAFGANSINGGGITSFEISTTTNHNLSWDEFFDVDTLVYQTTGDVELGVDTAKDISNAELALIGASANRLFVETTGDITLTSVTSAVDIKLWGDRDRDGAGNVNLNGLTNTGFDLTILAENVTGDGASVTDADTITIQGGSGQDIFIGASGNAGALDVSTAAWNYLSASNVNVVADTGGTIYWENNNLQNNVTLDSSLGAGTVFQNGTFTFAGAHTLQLIGDTYITTDLSMSNAAGLLDIDGALFVGTSDSIGGNDSVTVSGIWDTAGLTDVFLMGDAADAAILTHIADTDFSLPSILSTNGVNLDITSNGSITAGDITVGDLLLDYDVNSNSSAANMLTLSGTNSVNGLTLSGSGSNDSAVLGGTWTIGGNVTTATMSSLNLTMDTLTANSFDFSGTTNVDFGAGAEHSLTATGGGIVFSDIVSNRDTRITAAGTIGISAITTTDNSVYFTADDVNGDGSAINLGTAEITFRTNLGTNALSVGDAGVDTFTIEANIWDNLTVGSIKLDGYGSGDTITFLEDSLPADLSIDGPNGTLTFDGVAQNFTGAQVVTNTDVVILQDFTSDSALDIDGALTIGASDTIPADVINVTAPLWFSGVTDITLAGDTGDTVNLTSVGTTGMQVATVSSPNGNPDLNVSSEVGMDLNGFSGGSLTVSIDTDNNGTGAMTSIGTYSLSNLQLIGTGNNDTFSFDGTWAISGDVTSTAIGATSFLNSSLTANSFDFSGASLLDFGTGSGFTLTSTGGNITLADLTADQTVDVTSAGAINISAITTLDDQVWLRGTDVTGDGSAINVGTGILKFQVTGGDNNLSIGDAGVDAYTIEANIWDNITAGEVILDVLGTTDNVTFLEDTAPANLTFQAADGTVTFDGVAQNFVGADLIVTGDAVFKQDFSSNSIVDIDGGLVLGASNAATDILTLSGDFRLDGITAFDMAGDTGDTVVLNHNGSNNLAVPVAITTSNGDVLFDLNLRQGGSLNGFEGSSLLVEIDSNNNGSNTLSFAGTYNVAGLVLNGNDNGTLNDDISFDGTWTISDSVVISGVSGMTLLNDSLISGGSISVNTDATLTLGSSLTNYALEANGGNLVIGDIVANRPMTISTSGTLSAGYIDVASRPLSLTSNSDLSVDDEGITISNLRAGDLTIAGDFDWTFNSVLSGIYTQTRGDVSLTDVALSAFGMDLSAAESLTLNGTTSSLEARSGDIMLTGVSGTSADLTVTATGSITANNISTGTGDLSLNSDTDASGAETITLANASGNVLSLSDAATLSGTVDYSSIVTTSAVTLNDAALTVASLDNSTWASTTLTGTSNSLTADAGNVVLDGVTGTSADLTVTATGSITASNISTGTGDLSLDSDTDASGAETITLANASGNVLTLSDAATLSGTVDYSSIVTTSAVTLNDAALTVASLDNSTWASTTLTGTSNSLTINGGNLVLDSPSITAGSNLALNVGAGSHSLNNLDIGSGAISINGINATSNQLVTASGTWGYDSLTVSNIDTFTNNAQLVGTGDSDINVTNNIVLADGSTITSDRVYLTAGNDLTVTGVTAVSQQIPSVVLTAGGSLIDGGNSNTDLDTYWVDSVEYNITGNQGSLDVIFEVGGDISAIEDDIASVSDPEIDIIEDESESTNPLDGTQASVGSLPKSRVDVVIPQCSGNDRDCRRKNALRKFLSSLMIGGALPE